MSASAKPYAWKQRHRDAEHVAYRLETPHQLMKWIHDFDGVIVFPSKTKYSRAIAGGFGKAEDPLVHQVFRVGNLTVLFIDGGIPALWKEHESLTVFAKAVAKLNQEFNPMKDADASCR